MIRPGTAVKYQNRIVTVESVENTGHGISYIIVEGMSRFTVPQSEVTEIYNEGTRSDPSNENVPLYS